MEFQAYDIALVPIIVGLVGVARTAGLPARWLPLLAVVLGLVSGFVYIAPDEPQKAVLSGVVMGLSAIGAWSGTKNTIQSLRSKK
ncbi:hypothetical protein [Paenibacillus alkalitolerans]|uniref:hypothetical protein n=1 Tax=Paenibacillus alkalitolerans TaxID=2799335 RepID=UPI0018F54622|nr:hypothetical protein [Paenibacillus alkalitolerans]